jgi:hypothetical protein
MIDRKPTVGHCSVSTAALGGDSRKDSRPFGGQQMHAESATMSLDPTEIAACRALVSILPSRQFGDQR